MSVLEFMVGALWVAVFAMAVVIWIMLRQIGVLYERVAPVGALADSSGPKIGERAPAFTLSSLTGGDLTIGMPGRAALVFFLSPTCPVCKQLLPVLDSMRRVEGPWLRVVLASDGDRAKHEDFIRRRKLESFPYVLSTDLGMTFRVQRLPFAVLIDEAGVVRAKGLVNNREQLESLLNTIPARAPSQQAYAALHAAE